MIIGINKHVLGVVWIGAKSYKSKVIVSGDIIEIYDYDVPILEGFNIKDYHDCGRSFEASEEDKLSNREKVLNRARRDVRRLINCNIEDCSKFVTLTFAENIVDLKVANYEFKKFRQKLERYLKHKLKYISIVEFQKRGAIHYHVVMFNVPYIKNSILKEIWGNGFVRINKIDNVDNVGAYVTKYMTKDCNDDRLIGEKMYFTSRGLSKPIEIKEKERVDNLAVALPSSALVYQNEYQSEYNKTYYKQYNMKVLKKEDGNIG